MSFAPKFALDSWTPIHVYWILNYFFLYFQVFNNLMVKEHEKRHIVYCLHCSLAQEPNLKGFICLEEYTQEELCKVYDEFQLLPLSAANTPPSGLGYCQQTSKIWKKADFVTETNTAMMIKIARFLLLPPFFSSWKTKLKSFIKTT